MNNSINHYHISRKTGIGKSTLSKLLANKLKATFISCNNYDEVSTEPDDYIFWYQSRQNYSAFSGETLSKTLQEIK